MNSHAAKAAAGAKVMRYGDWSAGSAVTALALPALCHEPRHVVSTGEVAGKDGGVCLTDSLQSGPIAQQLQSRRQRLQVFSRNQHHVLAGVPRDVDALVRAGLQIEGLPQTWGMREQTYQRTGSPIPRPYQEPRA